MTKAILFGALALVAFPAFSQVETNTHREYRCEAADAKGYSWDAQRSSRRSARRAAVRACERRTNWPNTCVVVDCERVYEQDEE